MIRHGIATPPPPARPAKVGSPEAFAAACAWLIVNPSPAAYEAAAALMPGEPS